MLNPVDNTAHEGVFGTVDLSHGACFPTMPGPINFAADNGGWQRAFAALLFQSQVYQDRQAYTLQAQAYADPDNREPNDIYDCDPAEVPGVGGFCAPPGAASGCSRGLVVVGSVANFEGWP